MSLPEFETVRDEVVPLKGYSQYVVHPNLGKIYNLKSRKWLLSDNPKGTGDKGYLLTKLLHDSGEYLPIYEHEAVMAVDKNVEPKSWRKEKLEIDHKDGNVKNNSISNLKLGTSSQNKQNRSYDVEKNSLTFENAEIVREEFKTWEGRKTDFHEIMAMRFCVTERTIQNCLLGVTYKAKPKGLRYDVDVNGVVHNVREVN
ncbi:hypothetical protein AN964_14150 [Heyndrickxia shackletonii]|uniref:HNH nuclease domain-containing protein n=1 Tax=Heyndrickxia shackletonii TaxID=157838 RepID=A0A0Q3WZ36_9BACI|nr:HNH endonuclease [Heyndrickxia shackletonii]KQL54523.1 hypothetical protein AN964_14150 [Heyndrickxia shackletonii]NEZ02053.1 HNH endonuclease [Heyndrickxia shackletonii]